MFASEDLIDCYDDKLVLQIPNKLIISPLHVQNHMFGSNALYSDVFKLSKELFDVDHPFEKNH